MICSGGLCVPQAAPNCSSGDGCIQDQCISLATGSGPGSYVCEHTPTCPCPGVDCNITVTATRIDTGICADGSGNPVGCPTCSDQVCTTASTGPGLCGGDSYLPPEPYCNKYYVGTGLNLVTYCKIEGPGLTGDYPTPPSFPGDGAICFMPTGGFALCSAGGTSSCTPGEALAPPGSYYTN